jgi:beta-barrel assembly-enhancing protease
MITTTPRLRLFTLLLLILLPISLLSANSNFRQRVSATFIAKIEDIIEDVKAEITFGRDIAAQILGRYPLYDGGYLNQYVNLVGHAVARQGNRPEITYNFAIIQSDEINAYATPGGYIFITTGAIRQMRDEAELAGVLAHEVAHVTQRHIVKELDIKGEEKSAEAGLTHFLGGTGDPARVAFAQAVDKALVLLFEKGLKQADEFEADRVGTLIAATTGYDASGLSRYLSEVKRSQGPNTAILSHTHPAFDVRIERLRQFLAAEGLDESLAPSLRDRFKRSVQLR